MANSVYFASGGRFTIQASAHAATAGFAWLINPVGSNTVALVKHVRLIFSPTAATAFTSAPRITIERVTFTGTASGAAAGIGQRNTADPAAVCSIRTASTGLSLVAGSIMFSGLCPAVMTGVSGFGVAEYWLPQNANDYIILKPGEGLVIRQPDAGTTSDTRLCVADILWEEQS